MLTNIIVRYVGYGTRAILGILNHVLVVSEAPTVATVLKFLKHEVLQFLRIA